MMEWQPIETAPKDGTVILGFDPSWYDIATPILWNGKNWEFFHIDEPIMATHWMPLPSPPQAKEE